MTDTVIKLGNFTFQDLEIPESINFGGKQQLVEHDLIGGNRIIDSLGKNDIDISWSGLMQGPNSLTRANQLNQMRVLGQQIQLTWFNLIYNVVISDFEANTERFYQVRYSITVKVISDGNNPILSQNLVGFNQAINSDLNNVNTLAASINDHAVNSAITSLNNHVANIPNFDGASRASLLPVSLDISNAITSVQNAIAGPAKRLFGLTN